MSDDLPMGWEMIQLGNIAEFIMGQAPPSSECNFEGNGIPFVKAGEFGKKHPVIREWTTKPLKMSNAEDVLICVVGATCGKLNLGIDCAIGRSVAAIRSKKATFSNFLYYQLLLHVNTLRTASTGTAQGVISKDMLGNTLIALPPLNEQRRIVDKLDRIGDRHRTARNELNHMPKLIARYKQSVLAAAFCGDLTADWRELNLNVETAYDLVRRIEIERRFLWKKMELAKLQSKPNKLIGDSWEKKYKEPERLENTVKNLPNSWCCVYWQQVGLCQNGRAFPSTEYTSHGIKLLRPGNLGVSGEMTWTSSNTKFLDKSWLDQYPDYLIGENELVMNLTAQSLADEFLGRVCLSSKNENCLLNQRIMRLTPVVISPKFCFWLFKSPLFRNYVDGLNTGSLIQHMFSSQVDKFMLPLPPLEEQKEIVRRVEKMFEKIDRMEQEYQKAAKLCDRLEQATLAKAFRGELVPQDPNDEPASVLLEQVKREKAKGKIKSKK